MARKSKTPRSKQVPWSRPRQSSPLWFQSLQSLNRRAHDQANRRSGRRELKSIRAAIAAVEEPESAFSVAWMRRLTRWLFALILLPLCWVTTWTFLARFLRATVQQGFWQSAEFWYFATGMLLMIGWFASGLLKTFFLYLYVLGHELTHAVFVLLFRGKVTDFHVSAEGGYITTNKTNLLIALSPYFVPFWSVVFAMFYGVIRLSTSLEAGWDLAFYALMGLTWTFHMVWTLWMIPRDQPDLKENGTFLSLVVIYFANLLVLIGLFCIAEETPLLNARDFAREWLRHAATSGDLVWRFLVNTIAEVRAYGLL